MFFLYLFMDVSNLGFGGIFGIKWFFNFIVVIYLDNFVVVYVINKIIFKDIRFM